ncbi:MAG TPA: ATP-binding cassette domain-containing protein [Chitinophagales bacterium]|nr:ATP-binding cassette domain-containing protein [Chitinophagales bacterium]
MLIVDNLSIDYGKGNVLSHLNFRFREGNIYGNTGENGIGKSSLLNAIANIINYTGVIYSTALNNYLSETLYLPSDLFFYPKMTGAEYVLFYLKARKKQSISLSQWNEKFKLPLKHYISSYSSGMQKKLALMPILMIGGYLILLDEPFNSLDKHAVNTIIQILLEQNKVSSNIVIITSHNMEVLNSICSEIYQLNSSSLKLL